MKRTTLLVSIATAIVLQCYGQGFDPGYKPLSKLTQDYEGYSVTFHFSPVRPEGFKPKDRLFYQWWDGETIGKTQGAYKGSLLVGEYLVCNKAGLLVEKGEFHEGLKQGKWKTWYENGNLRQVSNWKTGLPDGRWVTFDEKGLTQSEKNFSAGKLDGPSIEYENGVAISKTNYRQGREIDNKKDDSEGKKDDKEQKSKDKKKDKVDEGNQDKEKENGSSEKED
ncbi:MAG: hypothetical protein JXA03_10515 [Bacteroidales bacterium]|nr:hypothetical protein [Bacteroidales bacterium]